MKEMQQAYATLITSIGEQVDRDGLKDTPLRAAKAFSYLTSGYQLKLEDVINGALFESINRELVVVKDIEFYSLCEHHLLPFVGRVHIGYLPMGKVLGLSKLARITDMFARRLQIQESLSQQIAEAIIEATGARGVAVVIEAQHYCMMMRGVEKQHSTTRTNAFLGDFADDRNARQEFLAHIQS